MIAPFPSPPARSIAHQHLLFAEHPHLAGRSGARRPCPGRTLPPTPLSPGDGRADRPDPAPKTLYTSRWRRGGGGLSGGLGVHSPVFFLFPGHLIGILKMLQCASQCLAADGLFVPGFAFHSSGVSINPFCEKFHFFMLVISSPRERTAYISQILTPLIVLPPIGTHLLQRTRGRSARWTPSAAAEAFGPPYGDFPLLTSSGCRALYFCDGVAFFVCDHSAEAAPSFLCFSQDHPLNHFLDVFYSSSSRRVM